MLAFIPWGYFAGRYLGSVAKLILSTFFALLSLCGVIAFLKGPYDAFWAFVAAFAFCVLCSYLNWKDADIEWEDLKLRRRLCASGGGLRRRLVLVVWQR